MDSPTNPLAPTPLLPAPLHNPNCFQSQEWTHPLLFLAPINSPLILLPCSSPCCADHAVDTWSIGCVLYELCTGKILFPGRSNNEMLKLMMDVKGAFPKKMLRRGAFAAKHFEDDPNMSFAHFEEDPISRKMVRRLVTNPTVKASFAQLLARSDGDRSKVA